MQAHAIDARPQTPTLAFDRPERVTALVLVVVLLSLFDLAHTLTYMRGVGMLEMNPLARFMVELGGASQLVMFKMFTVALGCGVMYILRRHAVAERCAWISAVALLLLTAWWLRYNASVLELTALADVSSLAADPRWVMIE